MRRRVRLLVLLCLAVLAVGSPAVLAGPASATLIDEWTFDQHPDGFPASTDAARTLESASGAVTYASDGEVQVHVVLGGVPDETTAAVLHLALGTADTSGACVTAWETSLPTWTDTDASAGRDLDLTGAVDPGTRLTCGEVWLASPDAAQAYDELDGRVTDTVVVDPVVVDPAAGVRITKVAGTRVRPHHWQEVRLRVRCSGSRVDGLEVRGHGHDVEVRQARVELSPEGPRSTWIAVRVRLGVAHSRRVVLQVRPYGELMSASSDRRVVRLRPVEQ